MQQIEAIVFLLVVIVAFSAVVRKVKLPQSIVLVIVGLVIGFTPQLPDFILKPETVFLVFLPPLLFTAAWNLSWHDFKAERRPIISLATGLVFFTTVAIAFVAHHFIPGFSWPLGFVLGAIISPSDAVAATSITKGLSLNKRVITILEGESLLNDASALVAYRYAIASVASGGFIFWEAGVQFLWISAAGIAVGLMIGAVFSFAHRRIMDNATLEVALTLLTPYVAYLTAEHFHLSGVLSVVAAGLFISFKSPETFSYQTRIQASSFWETIEFLLNGFVFILIGMQLPSIIADMERSSLLHALGYGLLITGVAVGVRILWVFPGAVIPVWLSKKSKKQRNNIERKYIAIIGWTGMRGVVSLASALAIPLTLANGKDFPQREMILFITFCVIFFTLVVQGLTLPLLIKWLNITPDHLKEEADENVVRKLLATKALTFINENIANEAYDDRVIKRLREKYDNQLRFVSEKNQQNKATPNTANAVLKQYTQTQRAVLDHERAVLVQIHKEGKAASEILKKLEFELDIEEARLNEQMKRIK